LFRPVPEAEGFDVVAKLTRGERLQIMLTQDEINALDNWRFKRHMPSRASAIRELLKRGLAAEGFDLADFRNKSSDFGVTGEIRDYETEDSAGCEDGEGE
jgi:hypothetical protein